MNSNQLMQSLISQIDSNLPSLPLPSGMTANLGSNGMPNGTVSVAPASPFSGGNSITPSTTSTPGLTGSIAPGYSATTTTPTATTPNIFANNTFFGLDVTQLGFSVVFSMMLLLGIGLFLLPAQTKQTVINTAKKAAELLPLAA